MYQNSTICYYLSNSISNDRVLTVKSQKRRDKKFAKLKVRSSSVGDDKMMNSEIEGLESRSTQKKVQIGKKRYTNDYMKKRMASLKLCLIIISHP